MTAATIENQVALLADNCVNVLPENSLAERLELAAREKRPLRIKFGMDPTAPDVHLGHGVVLQKLRQFQDLGHTAVLIIGDYTSRVGDPSGRSKTRPVLTPGEIDANAKTYFEQAFRILDRERTEVRYNGEWLGVLTAEQMFGIMREATVAQLLERDDFSKRYAAGEPISLLEMLYPLVQGYDSVAVESDIELGGTDQLYNLLMGRTMQSNRGLLPQLVMTLPLLVGTDGSQKMSKSLGNYIGVTESPQEMFGKAMSVPDEAMPEYYRLATTLSPDDRDGLIRGIVNGTTHPNLGKRTLGRLIVERFHGAEAAEAAEAHFDRLFKQKDVPDEMPEVALADVARNDAGKVFVPALLVQHLGVASNGEARRLVQQGGVKLDGAPLAADDMELDPDRLAGVVVQVGKRKFLRVT